MVSTMKIGEETKKSLLKIGAEHTMKDGKERSLEDIVKILIEEHKAKQKWIGFNFVYCSNSRSNNHYFAIISCLMILDIGIHPKFDFVRFV